MQEVKNGNEEFQTVFVKITVGSRIYKQFPCFIMVQKNELRMKKVEKGDDLLPHEQGQRKRIQE